MGTNTAQLRSPGATRLVHQFKQAIKAGCTLDSLKAAYLAAKRMCATGDLGLFVLAQKAISAIRKSASTLFGDPVIANIFLLGAY
mgnify:CR=1 FL=1